MENVPRGCLCLQAWAKANSSHCDHYHDHVCEGCILVCGTTWIQQSDPLPGAKAFAEADMGEWNENLLPTVVRVSDYIHSF